MLGRLAGVNPPDLSGLIKSYDVRGVVGQDLTLDVARAIGAAFADAVVLPEGEDTVVLGYDMRDSSPTLADAVTEGLATRGVAVISMGLTSTDGLYFASGHLNIPGMMITASHNPAQYNGMKMCRSRARAVGENSGLADVRDLTARYLVDGWDDAATSGTATQMPLITEYARFLRNLVPLGESRHLKVVVDAANAMGGYTVPIVLGGEGGLEPLPLEIIPLYFDLDGTFPNHEPNPLDEENLRDLQAAVKEHGADIGLAFDGDADRCFVVDEHGAIVRASAITALVGLREAARQSAQGAVPNVVYNTVSSMAVPELLGEAGAVTWRSKVGHSNVKAIMARHDAVFGGEHSAHFYFRDFWYADSGMLAAMHVLAALGESDASLSELLGTYDPYAASGEINSVVTDVPAAMRRIVAEFTDDGVELNEDDGVRMDHWETEPRWWISVRPSGTEPLLRLNVEAADPAQMERVRDRALTVIRQA